MTNLVEKIDHIPGIKLHFIPNKKFKTIHFIAKLRTTLSRETITMRALLPYVLRQGTSSYPTEQALQSKLDELYGATLSIDGAKKGNNHIISFRLEVANEAFIPDESKVINDALHLLQEVIFQPKTEGDSFDGRIFQRERKTLKQKIQSLIDNKMMYANIRLIDEMCENEAYRLHVHGYEEDLETLTSDELYTYYEQMLQEDQFDLYVLGDFERSTMENKIKNLINRKDHHVKMPQVDDKPIAKREEPKVVIEEQDVQQAKLHLGYRTNCTFRDDNYFALQVFNGLFGGFPSSKLFINVREKNSLAYYAASRLESHKGLLLVFSGIDAKDYQQAREIIEQQMQALKKGDFTKEELEETKELVIHQILETLDNPQGIVELMYQQEIANNDLTPQNLIKNIKKVTKEDVVYVAKNIHQDTVYLLTEKGRDA